jgi:Glycosyl transferase family 2.
MIENKLSIIIPFIQEHPQLAFAVQSLFCELNNRCDFEIIVIDNYCNEFQEQLANNGHERDHGSAYMKSLADNKRRPWFKYITYDQKMSHWNAKNAGVNASDGEFLFFLDAHCIISQRSSIEMYSYYSAWWMVINGSLHLPISYFLEIPGRELIYKLIADRENGIVHYSFTRLKEKQRVHPVPCMSTCGMMIHRSLFDKLGGWPTELGAYGGGEHFFNFTLATMGHIINIFPHGSVYHYAVPREYNATIYDSIRNRAIATYMFGGMDWMNRFIQKFAVEDSIKDMILNSIIESPECIAHKKFIESNQTISIDEWLDKEDNL